MNDKKESNTNESSEILTLRLESDLPEQIIAKAKSLNLDVSTFVELCIQTGLMLGEVDSFVRSRMTKDLKQEVSRPSPDDTIPSTGVRAIPKGKHMKSINIEINSDLLERLEDRVKKLDTDIATYVKRCIGKGLRVENSNSDED